MHSVLNQTSTTSSQLELNHITYNNERDVHLHLYVRTIIKESEQSVILRRVSDLCYIFKDHSVQLLFYYSMEKLDLLLNKILSS